VIPAAMAQIMRHQAMPHLKKVAYVIAR
jgi:hypothetical protein